MSKLAVICIFLGQKWFLENKKNLNIFRRNCFASGIFLYFGVWFLTLTSDYQIYKIAGRNLLEAFYRGVVNRRKCV